MRSGLSSPTGRFMGSKGQKMKKLPSYRWSVLEKQREREKIGKTSEGNLNDDNFGHITHVYTHTFIKR